MAEEFRVKVGIEFDPASSASFKSSVESSLKNTFIPIKIKPDQSSIASIKNELKDLGKGIKIDSKGKDLLPITSADIQRVTSAFESMSTALTDIRNALGTIDDNSDFSNIVTSVNEAKQSVSGLITEVTNLKSSLDNANFSFSINMGNNDSPIARNAKYGSQARETIKDLKKQALELEEVFKNLYHTSDGVDAVVKSMQGTNYASMEVYQMLGEVGNRKASLKDQMNTYREYISLMKEIANTKGIDISSATSGFTKSAEDMVKDTEKILTGEQELEESTNRLKNIFGNGLSVEGLTEQVDRIIAKIGELKTVIESLSKGVNVNGVSESLGRIAQTLDTLLTNGLKLQNGLKATFQGVSSSVDESAGHVKQVVESVEDVGEIKVNANPIAQVDASIETSTENIVENVNEVKEAVTELNEVVSAYTASMENVGYHAGTISRLNKAETNGRFVGSRRDTGYYGTGHYFVDANTKHELDSNGYYNKLPYTSIDLSKYDNLFKADTDKKAYDLHEFLKNLTRYTQGSDSYDMSELFAQFENVFGKSIMNIEQFTARLNELKSFMESSELDDRSDSVSTQFMKSLGYGGVDTRGTRYADTRYGTVVYDLKEESILQANITDEIQKRTAMLEQQRELGKSVFDESEDTRIQGILDQQKIRAEIAQEYKGLFDPTNLKSYEQELGEVDERLKHVQERIEAINNFNFDEEYEEARRNFDEANRMFSDLNGDDDIIFDFEDIYGSKEDWIKTQRKTNADDLEEYLEEQEELLQRQAELRTKYEEEEQKSVTAYQKAQDIVKQRHSQPAQADTTAFEGATESIHQTTEALNEEAEAAERAKENAEKIKNELIKVFQAKDAGNAGDSFTEQQFDNMADYVSSLMTEVKSVQGYLNDQGKLVIKVEGVDEAQNAITVVREFETAIQGNQVVKELEGWEVKIKSTFRTSSDEVAEQTKILESNLTSTANQIAKLKQELEKAKQFDKSKNATGVVSDEVQEAERQLTELQNTFDKLLNDVNAGNVNPKVFNDLKRISEEADRNVSLLQSKFADEKTSQKANSDFQQLETTAKRIVSLKESIGKLELKDGSSNVVAFYKSQLEGLEETYKQLSSSFKEQFPNFDESKIERIKSLFAEVETTIGEAKAKMQDLNETMAQKAVDKFEKFATKNEFDKLSESFAKIKNASPEAVAEFEKLKSAYESLCVAVQEYQNVIANDKSTTEEKANAVNKLIEANNAYKNSVEATSNIVSIDTRTQKQNEERVKSSEQAFKKMLSISNGIKNIKLEIEGLKIKGGGEREIQVLERELTELESVYEKATQGFKLSDLANGTNIDFNQLVTLQNNLDGVGASFDKLRAKMLDTKEKLASSIAGEMNMSTNANKFDAITSSLSKLDMQSAETRQSFSVLESDYQRLLTAVNNFNAVNKVTQEILNSSKSSDALKQKALETQANAYEKIIDANKKYQESLKTTKNYVDIDTRAMKERQAQMKAEADARSLALDKSKFASEIDAWATKNSAAMAQFGDRIADIKAQIASADGVELNNLKTQFKTLTNEATTAGVATKNFADTFKSSLSRLTTYFSGMMLIMRGISTVKEMFNNVKEVDTSMTELYRITNLSDNEYENLFSNMTNSAKEYGTALSEIINSTASWVRLGFDTNDANRLAEITAMYQHVTDLDETTAVNNLVTAYKGFQDQLMQLNNGSATDAVEMVADIYDKLGNEFAESAADVGDGLSKSASVLAQGGASIQEAAGMFTGMQETLQDSSSSGSALKILTLRIRGMKGDLEELGEEVDENVDSISKMQTQILNWTHGKVNIFDDQGNFRNIYDIMSDIAGIYDKLSDTDQASLLEGIAGKNRANAVQAMLNNWENVEKATKAAYNSAGTAQNEQDTWANSMEAHLEKLHSAWEALSVDFLDTGFLNGLIDAGRVLVNVFDGIIDYSGKFQNDWAKSINGTTNAFSKMSGTISTILTAIAGGFAINGSPMFNLGEIIKGTKIDAKQIFPNLEATINADITALQNYVTELDKIKTTSVNMSEAEQRTMAFERTMTKASVTAQTYATQNVVVAESVGRLSKDIATSAIQVQAQDKSFKNVKAIIDRYNQGFENAVVTQDEFVSSVSRGNASLGRYLTGLNGAEANANKYRMSLFTAKLETIGLQVATVALNMAITMGLSIAFTALFSAMTAYATKAKEAREANLKLGESAKSQAQDFNELYTAYLQASSAYKTNSGSKEALTGATEELLSALGVEGVTIKELVKEYGDLDTAITKVSFDALISKYNDLRTGLESAKEKFEDEAKKGVFDDKLGHLVWMEDTQEFGKQIGEILEKAKLISSGGYAQGGELFFGDLGEIKSYDDAIEAYSKLIEMRDALLKGAKDEGLSTDDIYNSDIYGEITDKINFVKESYEDIDDYIRNINDTSAQLAYVDFVNKNGIPDSIQDFEALDNAMKNVIEDGMEINGTPIEFVGSDTDAQNAIDNLLSDLKNYDMYMDIIEKKKSKTFGKADKMEVTAGLSWSLNTDESTEQLRDAYYNYKRELNEYKDIKPVNLPLDDLINVEVGNIDLANKNRIIEWTDELKEKFAEQLSSWNIDDIEVGDISTVLGSFDKFKIDNQEFPIAFTPILMVDDNAELLGRDEVNDYIQSILEYASENIEGEISFDDILNIDARKGDFAGFEYVLKDGTQVKNLIADIGDTALQTSESMHYLGANGSLSLMQQEIRKVAEEYDEAYKEIDNFNHLLSSVSVDVAESNTNSKDFMKIKEQFDKLSDEAKLTFAINFDADDTALWDITKWEEEIRSIGECGLTTAQQLDVLKTAIGDTSIDNSIASSVEAYTNKLKALQDASQKLDLGTLTSEEKVKLAIDYPELAGAIGDVDSLKNAIDNLIDASNQDMSDYLQSEIDRLRETAPLAAEALQALKDQLDALSSDFDFNIDDEITKFENLYTAMKNSVSGTGLKAQDIKNVEAMFSGLKGYDHSALFERTANGIHMNTKELRNLQAQYKENKLKELNKEIEDSIDEYNRLGQELSTTSDAMERAGKMKQMEGIKQHIQDVADLASEYVGLTSAYNAWQQAQSAGEEGDMYDAMRNGLKDAKEAYEQGLTGTNAFRTYVDLLSNKDLSNAGTGEAAKEWERLNRTITGTSFKATDFLAEGSDGVLNFLNAVQQLNKDWVKMNSDGSWDINFGVGTDEEVAKKLGIDVEFVQSMLRKLSDYDFEINLDSPLTGLENLTGYASDAVEKLNELKNAGKIDFDIPEIDLQANSENVDAELDKVRGLLENYRQEDGTLNLNQEGGQEVETILISLMTQKQLLEMPSILTVDTSNATKEMQDAIKLLSDLQTNYNDLQIQTEIGADTSDAQSNIQSIIEKINGIEDKDIRAALNLDDADFQSAISTITSTEVDVKAGVNLDETALSTIQSTISGIDATVIAKFTADTSAVDAENAKTDGGTRTTKYKADTTETDAEDAKTDGGTRTTKYKAETSAIDKVNAVTDGGDRSVTYRPNTSLLINSFSTIYRDVVYRVKGNSPSNGTANSFGIGYSTGTAFVKGSWGTKKDGVALGGEVGQELVVRDGKFFTIGDDGAEFFSYKKDDIIFNAGQTAQIFKYGRIKNGKKRGEVFAQGNAFAEGTAFSSGSGTIKKNGKTVTSASSSTKKSTSSKSKSNSSKSKSSSSKESEKDFDWIEIAIKRIERAISNLDTKAKRTFATWSSRTKNLRSEISKVTEEIALQNSAYDAYIKQANSIGLSSTYVNKIKNGSMDVSTIKDEDLADKISKYQQWYEKALECKDAILELENTEAELYKTLFDNIVTKYEKYLEVIEHHKSMIDEYISQSEEKGYLVSGKYYEALINQEKKNINKLKKERDALYTQIQEAVNSGAIKVGSEDWYEMCNQIDEVTLSIEQANTHILELGNSIRQLKWDVFDLIEDRISKIADEADFLIDLMSHKNLFEENGSFTDEGEAVLGLHAVNYNTYMAQSDEYAKELLKLKKQIAKDPNDLKLQERYQELLELQQESILAAEEEKEAMADLVSEGIEKELSALKDLIDKYNDALDAQKDLYDYQKKVKDQTKEIASLQKQLSAYSNDTSEETKAKVQQLKVSLENAQEDLRETEYEKYISDQKKLLDDLYTEYESILNQRLDNIDALIGDLINEVNSNSGNIAETIQQNVSDVGYTLTDSMNAIWANDGNATGVVAQYSRDYTDALTSVNTTITDIKNYVSRLVDESNKDAKETLDTAPTPASKDSKTQPTPKPAKTQTTTPKSTTTSTSTSKTTKQKWGVALAIWNGNYGWGTGDTRKKRLQEKGFNYSEIQGIVNKGYNTVASKAKSLGITSLSPYHYNKFAHGVKDITKSQFALTQEDGIEYVIRPSDGAILTPLAKGDSVLTNRASQNIWDMANDPSKFILDSLKLGDIGGTVSSIVSNDTYNNDVSMTISLPNVMSYEQFKYAMQHDKNFEKMIQSMTVDKMFGGSSLKKYKF